MVSGLNKPKHRIALVGFGTVARGLCRILNEKQSELLTDYGFDFHIVAVTTRSRGTMYDPEGLSLSHLIKLSEKSEPFLENRQDWDALAMIQNCNATIILELGHTNLSTGEPAVSYCRAALTSGKHVVCANKGPATLAYRDLRSLAQASGKHFLNEATVLSGTPILSLARSALAGIRITGLRGILNGTTNFILSEMEAGKSYSESIAEAAAHGYLEADQALDLEGFDARAKLSILARTMMDLEIELEDIHCQGISGLDHETVQAAAQQGFRWKLVASLEQHDQESVARVQLEKLSLRDPLAQVGGTTNALTLSTDLLGDITITGPGAGEIETAYAVLSDLLTIHSEANA